MATVKRVKGDATGYVAKVDRDGVIRAWADDPAQAADLDREQVAKLAAKYDGKPNIGEYFADGKLIASQRKPKAASAEVVAGPPEKVDPVKK